MRFELPTTINIRKIITVIIVILILLLVFMLGYYVYHLLSTGVVVANTDEKENTINIIDANNINNGQSIKSGKGKLSARLKPGHYYIEVSNGSASKASYIDVSARKSNKYTINPANLHTSDVVAYVDSSSIAANNNQIIYLSDSQQIKIIDNNDSINIFSDGPYKTVSWANADYGIAKDNSNNLFLIQNNVLSPYYVPDYIKSVKYGISLSRNKILYAWTDRDVYRASGTSYKKIFTISNADKKISNVIADNNNIAVISDNFGDGIVGGDEDIRAIRTVHLVSDEKILASKDLEINIAAMSLDGSYLATTSVEGTQIYDNNLNQMLVLPNTNVENLMWLDSSQVIYSVSDKIIVYNIKSKESYTLTYPSLGGNISYIAISDDKQNAFYISKKYGVEPVMNQVSFIMKDIPSNTTDLQKILPKTFTDPLCYVRYINFTRPTIEMTVQRTDSATSECKVKTIEYLKQYEINPVNYYYSTKLVVDD